MIEDIRKSLLRGNKSVITVLGCGGGKSIIQAEIARSAALKNNRVLFLVHRKELCQQIENTFIQHGVNMELCNVGMVQTISRQLDEIPEPAVIITDEAHHSAAKTYTKIYNKFPDAVRLGFTATPIRLNKGGLGDVYSDMITSVSTKWLIDNHYLSPYKYYSVKLADTANLHTRCGDYKQNEISELMQNKFIYGETVKQWEKIAKGKKTIVYCSSVEASEQTAKQFRESGYVAYSLDGTADKERRKSIMNGFRNGSINILCNCDLFGEGLDVPDCECVVLLRPTQSLTLYIQQSMRSMRYMPNKTAIIIDHVGNCYLHGLPDDDRQWTLESKHIQETAVKIRECSNCYAVYPPSLSRCPYCNYKATHEIQKIQKKIIDIDLIELARQEDLRKIKLCDAHLTSFDEVVDFQKAHKYKFMWVIRYCMQKKIPIPSKYRGMSKYVR